MPTMNPYNPVQYLNVKKSLTGYAVRWVHYYTANNKTFVSLLTWLLSIS